jgi:hypothetical protein
MAGCAPPRIINPEEERRPPVLYHTSARTWPAHGRQGGGPGRNKSNDRDEEITMQSARRLVSVASMLALAVFAPASRAEPMKELSAYKRGLGKWMCNAKELGSGKTFKAAIDLSADFDGHTYIERYYETKSAAHPNPWKAIFIMSYDAKAQRWVRNGVDNAGERNAASSSGWKGDTWVWENDGANIVVTNPSSAVRTFAVDVKGEGGVKRVVEATCKPA